MSCREMLAMAIQAVTAASLGGKLLDEETVAAVATNYHICWQDMEERLKGSLPAPKSKVRGR